MNKFNAYEVFDRVYHGDRNFMTPYIKGCYTINNFCIELSQGETDEHKKIYGVTVIEVDGRNYIKRHDLNKLFFSKKEALRYVHSLEGRE
jgi:hypothetical protein